MKKNGIMHNIPSIPSDNEDEIPGGAPSMRRCLLYVIPPYSFLFAANGLGDDL